MTKAVCLIEDDPIMGESLSDRLQLEGFPCDWYQLGASAMAAIQTQPYQLVISDIRLPDITGEELFRRLQQSSHALPRFIFITGFGDIDMAVSLLKQGACDYLTKPFDLELLLGNIRSLCTPEPGPTDPVLGVSDVMRHIESVLLKLANNRSSVLITGESGVGKEWVASTLHRLSLHQLSEQTGPFIAVNCGALTESLLEAELFGYEKGAFTGAHRTKPGLFEQAYGGMLFLDEIGDMPLSMQVKLLRVLQERQFVRVGGEKRIPFNARLASATHRDLKAMVQSQTFREDLYYRINVIHLDVPPLRERKEDTLWFARRFLAEFSAQQQKNFILHTALEHALLQYPWPGNIRELKHALERTCLLSESHFLDVGAMFGKSMPLYSEYEAQLPLSDYIMRCEREYILRMLETNSWHIQQCADALGISRKNLWEKMRKLGISGARS